MSTKGYVLPGHVTAAQFSRVRVQPLGGDLKVSVSLMAPPEGTMAEGWQTGVGLDASVSMRNWYGRALLGSVPPAELAEYQKRGWLVIDEQDKTRVRTYHSEALKDAMGKNYLSYSVNIIEPIARQFIGYLADELDADGKTTVLYWACSGKGSCEVLGDFDSEAVKTLGLHGPQVLGFGKETRLMSPYRYFVDRFKDAPRGLYVFLTDGQIDDLSEVMQFTKQLAAEIDQKTRNPVYPVMIGVGEKVDQSQLALLQTVTLASGRSLWNSRLAEELRDVLEIFAQVVGEHQIVATNGRIYDQIGAMVKQYTDGLPAYLEFTLPQNDFFELEVLGQRIRQTLTLPTS